MAQSVGPCLLTLCTQSMETRPLLYLHGTYKAIARGKCLGGGGGGGCSCTSDDHACKELVILKVIVFITAKVVIHHRFNANLVQVLHGCSCSHC